MKEQLPALESLLQEESQKEESIINSDEFVQTEAIFAWGLLDSFVDSASSLSASNVYTQCLGRSQPCDARIRAAPNRCIHRFCGLDDCPVASKLLRNCIPLLSLLHNRGRNLGKSRLEKEDNNLHQAWLRPIHSSPSATLYQSHGEQKAT